MPDFTLFSKAVHDQLTVMATPLARDTAQLFLTNVEKDKLWDTYLDSFPPGTNKIFRERREYDCTCCSQFIRQFGNIVSIVDNKLVSIWDVTVPGYYQEVADKMSAFVKSASINNIFVPESSKLGTKFNFEDVLNSSPLKWDHFYGALPESIVYKGSDSIESVQAVARDTNQVFTRSITELTVDASETVIDLINQGSLYRGDEFKWSVEHLLTYQKQYIEVRQSLSGIEVSDRINQFANWMWSTSLNCKVAKIKNSAIGTLLVDISNGVELDAAVAKFEKVVAPDNYKRPNAIFTSKMVEDAQKKIESLGFDQSLGRRHAVTEDITVNNVLFANRDTQNKMLGNSIFDELKASAKTSTPDFNKVEEVTISQFVNTIIPNATNVELMLDNTHQQNLMSLIAPQTANAKTMFAWDNNFSWAYNGDIADSMKTLVKTAGGNVDGHLRFSIKWNDGDNNQNDFDAHCIEPNGNLISYPKKGHMQPSTGMLDVDIVNPGGDIAVENITWANPSKMQEGKYTVLVHNYSHNGGRTGFTAEIECDGQLYSFAYDRELKNNEKVIVAEFMFSRTEGIKMIKSLESTKSSKDIWGIKTNKFQKVSMIMNSPNHWDDKVTGNKHYFFIIDGCKNATQPRGFFNEFLTPELTPHKRVFEALGSKMKVEDSDNQLSGVGFSSTNRNSIIAKVEGSFNRIIRIKF